MILYRITRKNFADLAGNGSRLYGGRWNNEGLPAIYLASSRSLAILESLAHIVPTNIPNDLCMMLVDVPDNVAEIDTDTLPQNWESYDDQYFLKRIGDNFLQKKEKLLLKVPSAIVKEEFNFLFNPLQHRATEAKISSIEIFTFDVRLLK